MSAILPRRLAELSRYGIDGKASLLKRHGDSRRLATLLATAVSLTSRSVDDALDLLEVLIATKLLARAERETAKEKLKALPRVERATAKLAAAFQIVFDTTSEQVDTDTGEITPPEVETLKAMWERIEQVVPRHELAAAIAALFELTPPLDSDADAAWRTQLVTRFGTVRPFLKLLVTVVDFGATPEGLPVLKALKPLPDLMGRKKVGPAEIDTGLLTGSWRHLVLSAPHLEPGTVDWKEPDAPQRHATAIPDTARDITGTQPLTAPPPGLGRIEDDPQPGVKPLRLPWVESLLTSQLHCTPL